MVKTFQSVFDSFVKIVDGPAEAANVVKLNLSSVVSIVPQSSTGMLIDQFQIKFNSLDFQSHKNDNFISGGLYKYQERFNTMRTTTENE